MTRLRTVEEQLDRVLTDLRVPEPLELALLDAQGLLCAEDVYARAPLPSFDNSSMDGYAVRAADTAGATETFQRARERREASPAGSACGS